MNEDLQLALLSRFSSEFKKEYEAIPRQRTSDPHQFYLLNVSFVSVDAEILYCMIRYYKPRRIIEIGSGMSTLLMAQAVMQNKAEHPSYACDFLAIDPYPKEFLRNSLPGLSRLVRTKVQEVALSEFTKLGVNDVLFIDSSHVLTIGSDVQFEFLEILPRLERGVIVHVHDIFLPVEYPMDWIQERHWFFNEQYLLQVFLAFNDSFETLWAASWMHLRHADRLAAAFRSYVKDEVQPGSFWLRRIK